MHFSSKLNIARDELAQESDIVFRKYLDAVESDDEVEAINIEVDHPRSSNPSGACLRATMNAKSNVDELSTHMREVIFEDNMVPKEFPIDLYHNTSREMWLGCEFSSRENFKRTIAKFAIYNDFTLKYLKTSQFKVTAHCKDRDCPWRIHASIIESGPQFKVRTYNPGHKCSKPLIGMAHRQASSELIAKYILDKVHLNSNLRPKEIMNDYQMEFGVTILYRKAHIAREMALCVVRDSYEDSFKLLPLYCAELKMMNPGSLTNIEMFDDDRFRRFFWAFAPSIRAFTSSLRPMIAVDGSHLRDKYHGVLLVAVTLDANHKLFSIAFAFAEAERGDN